MNVKAKPPVLQSDAITNLMRVIEDYTITCRYKEGVLHLQSNTPENIIIYDNQRRDWKKVLRWITAMEALAITSVGFLAVKDYGYDLPYFGEDFTDLVDRNIAFIPQGSCKDIISYNTKNPGLLLEIDRNKKLDSDVEKAVSCFGSGKQLQDSFFLEIPLYYLLYLSVKA